VDGHLTPLNNQLASGQTVEIITAKHARPNVAWLHFLRTGKARSGVRNFLKNQREDQAHDLGKRMLEKAMADLGLALNKLSADNLKNGLTEMDIPDLATLYTDIGLGRRLAPLVARHFLASDEEL